MYAQHDVWWASFARFCYTFIWEAAATVCSNPEHYNKTLLIYNKKTTEAAKNFSQEVDSQY